MAVNQIHTKNKWFIDWTIPTLRKSETSTWTSLLVWVLKGLNSMEGYMLCAVYMKSRCRCGCMTVYRNWNCVWLLRRRIHSSKWHLCGRKFRNLHLYKLKDWLLYITESWYETHIKCNSEWKCCNYKVASIWKNLEIIHFII